MIVSEVMVKDPVRVEPSTPVRELARLMRDKAIASIILVEDDKPVGIVTERDLVRRVLASEQSIDELKGIDICTKQVISTSPLADVSIAVDIMNDYNIRRIVVVDDRSGKVMGILTTDDIWQNFRRMSEELAIKYMITRQR